MSFQRALSINQLNIIFLKMPFFKDVHLIYLKINTNLKQMNV